MSKAPFLFTFCQRGFESFIQEKGKSHPTSCMQSLFWQGRPSQYFSNILQPSRLFQVKLCPASQAQWSHQGNSVKGKRGKLKLMFVFQLFFPTQNGKWKQNFFHFHLCIFHLLTGQRLAQQEFHTVQIFFGHILIYVSHQHSIVREIITLGTWAHPTGR